MTGQTANGKTGLLAADEIDRFQGFSTKDGEIVQAGAKMAEKPAAAAKKPAVTAPADDDEEAGDGADADSDGEGRAQRHSSAQARINKAVRRQRNAERALEAERAANAELRRRFDALEARLSAPPLDPNAKPRQQIDPNAPQPADYEFGEADARYIRDLARHETRAEIARQQQEHTQQAQSYQQQQEQAARKAELDKFVEKGLDKYDDFDEVVLSDNIRITPFLAGLLIESEYGQDIAYELASDKKEANRIAEMTPARQAAWFGRREAELSSASSDAGEDEGDDDAEAGDESETEIQPKTTKAPPPPRAKTRGSGGQQQVSAATSDFAAFERMASGKR